MKLKLTELYGELSKADAIPTVIVTEDSIFAAPFYPASTAAKARTSATPASTDPPKRQAKCRV